MASNTATIDAVGETLAFSNADPKNLADSFCRFFVKGTYSGFKFVVENSPDGTNYDPTVSYREDTGAAVEGATGHSPDNNETYSVLVPSSNTKNTRLRCTEISTGSVDAQAQSFNFLNSPPVQGVWVLGGNSSEAFAQGYQQYQAPEALNANSVDPVPDLAAAGTVNSIPGPTLPVPTKDELVIAILNQMNAKLELAVELLAHIAN